MYIFGLAGTQNYSWNLSDTDLKMCDFWIQVRVVLVWRVPNTTRETCPEAIQTEFLARTLKSQESVSIGALQNGGVRFWTCRQILH